MDDRQRAKVELEATTLRMFSVFFLVLALFVFAGTYWATDKTSTVVISLASGAALLGVAATCHVAANRLARSI
jgi:hypothetical protein